MQDSLFPDITPFEHIDNLEREIRNFDARTLGERRERLRYVIDIFPDGITLIGDHESVLLFGEAKMAFINGEFIAVILLSQAFIERWIQVDFELRETGKIVRASLEAKLEYLRKTSDIPAYILDQIDELRRKRNPLAHLKSMGHEYGLDQRSYEEIKSNRPGNPYYLLYKDAKTALSLMYTVATRYRADFMARIGSL